MNINFRTAGLVVVSIVAVSLFYFMGVSAYKMGIGLQIQNETQAGTIDASKLSSLSETERQTILSRLHPRALVYAAASVLRIALFFTTIAFSSLCGFGIVKLSVTSLLSGVFLLTLATGIIYAVTPAILIDTSIFEVSGIAAVSALLTLVAVVLVFVICFLIKKIVVRARRASV